jgi:hypothetical protein
LNPSTRSHFAMGKAQRPLRPRQTRVTFFWGPNQPTDSRPFRVPRFEERILSQPTDLQPAQRASILSGEEPSALG